ncbi:MAG: SH3 domain-containing protein [Clostridiales bacterium]|nr:SH3 domain-containing protein [Clostridiales bacterium]
MKKSDKKNTNKAENGSDKGIRHVEAAASFLNEAADLTGEYGQTEDMYDMWGLGKRDATVASKGRHMLLRLVAAVLVTALVIASVFFILPRTLPDLFRGTNIELFVQKEVNLMYDDTYAVVDTCVTNVFSLPDGTSARITQALYNEPVRVLDVANDSFTHIRTADGIEGYVRSEDLIEDTSSVEPDLHEYMLVISETSKNVMTHASQGTLITQVMMNTVLYADVKRDGVYQVSLPGGGTGWIGSSGVIEIEPRGTIEEVSSRYFVSSALSLVNATYMENGITKQGISMNGLVYVCSCVNGIAMPRTIEGQMEAGVPVPLEYDAVTGDLLIESIIPGDIVFLSTDIGGEAYEPALCTNTGTLLMRSNARTTIRLREFTADSDIASRIVSVRRVFSD